MNIYFLLWYLLIWMASTVCLRVGGHYLIRPDWLAGTVLLFAASFPAPAWTARFLCRRFRLRREEWHAGVVSLLLLTLLLDPFTTMFFSQVSPNMDPSVVGVFGGLMLRCCAGALLSVVIKKGYRHATHP